MSPASFVGSGGGSTTCWEADDLLGSIGGVARCFDRILFGRRGFGGLIGSSGSLGGSSISMRFLR